MFDPIPDATRRIVVSLLLLTAVFQGTSAQPQANSGQPGRCTEAPSSAPAIEDAPTWSRWGAGLRNLRTRSAEEAGLAADEVPQLRLQWAFAIPGVDDMRSQPAVAGSWLFLAGRDSVVRGLDARTGCIIWTTALDAPLRSGVTIAEAGREGPVLFIGDESGYVHALEARTGELLWSRRVSDHPHAWITGTPTAYDGKLYVPVSSIEVAMAQDPGYQCCTFRGQVVALDASDGEVLWQYFSIAEAPSERGTNREGTALFGPSGAPVWSAVTVDTMRNQLYFGVGQNYTQPWTSESSAIHAVDVKTGKRKWVFQATQGDAWNMACSSTKALPDLPPDYSANCPENSGVDFDFGAPPMLVSLRDGRDVLVAGQKSGVVYGLDPTQEGTVLWKTRVGRGGLLGGVHWGMAAQDDLVLVPVSDREDDVSYEHESAPGIVALNARTGDVDWSAPALDDTCTDVQGCFPGFSAAATAIPGALLAGSLDGRIQAFSTKDGRRLWAFDTAQRFDAVNEVSGRGGSIDVAGPVVAGGMLYVLSGYGNFDQMPGNVLLAYSVE